MDFLRVKRGRPKKLSEETKCLAMKRFLCEKQEKEGSLDALQIKYVQEGFSDTMQKMLRAIPVITSLPHTLKILPLVNLFEEAAKQLMMSQVELIAASLIFRKLPELDLKASPEELIFLIFFSAKFQVSNDKEVVERLQKRLSQQIRSFDETLNSLSEFTTISTKELIKECSMFNWQSNEINYLYYVDDLLRFCIPYQPHIRKMKRNFTKSRNRKGKNFKDLTKGKQVKIILKDKQEAKESCLKLTLGRRNESSANRNYRKNKFVNKKMEEGEMDDNAFDEVFRLIDLMPVKSFENTLKLDEVLDKGMIDYLDLGDKGFGNEGVEDIEDELDENSLDFLQEFTV